jgi:hypothetical protein
VSALVKYGNFSQSSAWCPTNFVSSGPTRIVAILTSKRNLERSQSGELQVYVLEHGFYLLGDDWAGRQAVVGVRYSSRGSC